MNNNKIKKIARVTSIIGFTTLASHSNAALVFGSTSLDGLIGIDPFVEGGTTGNTAREDGSGTFFASTSNAADALWADTSRLSSAYGLGSPVSALNAQGATIGQGLEVWGNGGDNGIPTLTTSITGLPSGTYDVFVAYLMNSDTLDAADIQAALGGGSLETYDGTDQQEALAGSSIYSLALAKVGTTAPGVTSFELDVGSTVAVRGIYVGVGYAAASVPEPSTALFGSLAGLGLIHRRRTS